MRKSVTRRHKGTEARRLLCFLFLACLASWRLSPASAQENTTVWQVFLQRDVNDAGEDRLTFINPFTGEDTSVEVIGERYTPAGDAVLYFDPVAGRVMTATPDGTSEPHPFIQLGSDTRRVDWLVSPDQTMLAWTLTSGQNSLTTITTVANLDGTNPRQVFVDGPRDSIRALPVAFNSDKTVLFMDFQPDGIADFTPFPQYAGLFALDLTTNQWERLPGEPGCFCGAGFGAGMALRLSVSQDLSGFDVRHITLAGNVQQTIPALGLRNYTQAGDVVISPDGTKAVYALAQIRDFGRPDQSTQTVFALVDLEALTQTALTEPITTFVEPLMWTEDNTAILLTSRQRDGTWKISLSDGLLTKIAEATYLGAVG